MAPFEYLLLFAVVILGLAVSNLATSLHKLITPGREVKWDWLAPLAALVAFLKIVTQWWTWHRAENLANGLTFEMYLAVLAATVLLFLLAARSLPDAPPYDLRAYYAAVRQRWWGLFLAHWLVTLTFNIWVQVQVAHRTLDLADPALLVGLLAVTLIFVKNRWWHTASLVGLAVLYVAQFFGQTLG